MVRACVCLAGISNAGLMAVRAVMMVWSLVPVRISAVRPTLVAMLTVVGLRTTVGVAMTMMTVTMSMTGATVTTTSPGY